MEFVSLDLARRLEAAEAQGAAGCVKALRRLRPKARPAVARIAGGTAIFVGIQSPVTQAIGVGLEGPVTESEVRRLKQFYFRRRDEVRVELCPLAHPSVTEIFGKRGYRVVEYSNMLTRRLGDEASRGPNQRRFKIETVGAQGVEQWARTVCEGFAEHFPVTPELQQLMLMFAQSAGEICYLATVRGKPAGGAALGIRGRVAGLFGASTLPQFRNRGIQSALLRTRLKDAKAAGCAIAMSIAQPGTVSHRNMERQDFQVAYTRVKFQKDIGT